MADHTITETNTAPDIHEKYALDDVDATKGGAGYAGYDDDDDKAHVADAEVAKYVNSKVHVDEATNKRLRSLLNRRVLPIMLVTYFCQTIDKSTLAFASIMGIQTDAHLVGQQYSWLGTILYFGMLAGEVPANRLIQRLPVAKFLTFLVFMWGTTVLCHAACDNFAKLMVVRFFLGLFESGVQPCLMTITAMYYKRAEHAETISFWYCMQGFQLMVGGLIAFGVSYITNAALKNWQFIFIIVGAFSVLWSGMILTFLPDSPMKAKCWSEEDKVLMIERLREDELGVQERHFKWNQFREAITDPLVWCYCLLQFISFIVVNGLSTFSNIIVKGLGFSLLQTELLNIAQGALSIMIFIGAAKLAKKTNQTLILMAVWILPAIVGTIVLMAVPVTTKNAPGMLIAFYLCQFVIGEGNLIFSVFLRNIAGQTKKTVVIAMCFISYATGDIIGPQVFQSNAAPRYISAWIAHIVLHCSFAALCLITRVLLMRRNVLKRRAAREAKGHTDVSETTADTDEVIEHKNAFADLTDRENPDFRYQY